MTTDRTRLLAGSLLLCSLLLGIFAGVALDRWLLLPRHHGGHRLEAGPGSRDMRGRFLRQLTGDLELSPEQRARIDTLLTRQQQQTREVLREFRPRLEQITAATHAGIAAVLTPDQAQRFEEIKRRRHRHQWGPFREGPRAGDTSEAR